MTTLQDLAIVANISAPARVIGNVCALRVTTTEASTITFQRSVDGTTFFDIPDISKALDGTDEYNLVDFAPGQFVRVKSTGEMTACKVLG
jgi:hypothetical protein